jgi:hypothetical protein
LIEQDGAVSHNGLFIPMKIKLQMLLVAAAGLVALCAASLAVANERQTSGPIKVNMAALEHAKMLISEGHMIADGQGAWRKQQSSPEQENEFIQQRGFEEYAKWHLGIDERHAENTKARYKFPYGDFENVRRSALLAAKGRARQHSYSEIEDAAVQLLEMIHSEKNKPPRRHSRSSSP